MSDYDNQPDPGATGHGPPPPQPGYAAPAGYYRPDPAAPYGRHPRTGEPYGEKSKIIAGVLQLVIGTLGIGRFYTGHIGMGIAQLLTCGGLGIWSLIDGILILIGDDVRDSDGYLLRS